MSYRYIVLFLSILIANIFVAFIGELLGSYSRNVLFYVCVIGAFLIAEKVGLNKQKVNWGLGGFLILIIISIDIFLIRE